MNEADTCREYVLPRLGAAGWDAEPYRISEQVTFTDGRIIPLGKKIRRGKQKRADYLLRYRRDFPIAIVEAKAEVQAGPRRHRLKSASDGGGNPLKRVDAVVQPAEAGLHLFQTAVETAADLDALLPTILDRAFRGEL